MTERKKRFRFVDEGRQQREERFKLIKRDIRGFHETEFQKVIRTLRKVGL